MPPDFPGVDSVVAVLGRWPSFHDAEIVRFDIERAGASTLTLKLAPLESGRLVTFSIEGITDFSLQGEDNRQNVIACLVTEPRPGGTRIILGPCYGLAGEFTATHISVMLSPPD